MKVWIDEDGDIVWTYGDEPRSVNYGGRYDDWLCCGVFVEENKDTGIDLHGIWMILK